MMMYLQNKGHFYGKIFKSSNKIRNFLPYNWMPLLCVCIFWYQKSHNSARVCSLSTSYFILNSVSSLSFVNEANSVCPSTANLKLSLSSIFFIFFALSLALSLSRFIVVIAMASFLFVCSFVCNPLNPLKISQA